MHHVNECCLITPAVEKKLAFVERKDSGFEKGLLYLFVEPACCPESETRTTTTMIAFDGIVLPIFSPDPQGEREG